MFSNLQTLATIFSVMCDDVCDVGDVGERLDASDSVCSDYQ